MVSHGRELDSRFHIIEKKRDLLVVGPAGGLVNQNSNVRLGRKRGSGIIQLPNSTTSNNSHAGIRCRGNSSVDGLLGSLNGNKGAKDVAPSCVDSLKP